MIFSTEIENCGNAYIIYMQVLAYECSYAQKPEGGGKFPLCAGRYSRAGCLDFRPKFSGPKNTWVLGGSLCYASLSSIPGVCPLDASGTLASVMTNKNVFRP